mmetsp:Transcript_34584/g.55955  ORF Transcript_34584/g.55955 Transcript_34584/m.55955 type:complete len:314 (-) Transcript_34584:532-1473(-)
MGKHSFIILPSEYDEESGEDVVLESVRVKLVAPGDKDKPPVSTEDVVKLVGTPSIAPVHSVNWSCIDGREEVPILATPGGDAGEFLLGLAAVSHELEIPSYETIKEVLHHFIRFHTKLPNRPFYMHTDEHIVEKLSKEFGQKIDITNPPLEIRHALIEKLVTPDYTGCGHLKLQLLHPAEYGVNDPNIIKWFLQAFYTEVWSGNKRVVLKVLKGEHKEGAVLLINQVCNHLYGPLVQPTRGSLHMFIFDEESVRRKRAKSTARFFSHITNPPLHQHHLAHLIQTLGSKQLKYTSDVLAAGLPEYEVQLVYKTV